MTEMQNDKELKNSISKKLVTTIIAKQTLNKDPPKKDYALIDYEHLMSKTVRKEHCFDFYKSYVMFFF